MRLDSRLSQHNYLNHMRQIARFRLSHPCEGFSGVVIGNFFLVRYHAVNGSERERLDKETGRSPRCTYNAFGLVKPGDFGSEIAYMYTAGCIDPFSFLLVCVVGVLTLLKDGFLLEEPGIAILVITFVMVLSMLITAIRDANACCAERGRKRILEVLKDPSKCA